MATNLADFINRKLGIEPEPKAMTPTEAFREFLAQPPPFTGPRVYEAVSDFARQAEAERQQLLADRAILIAIAWHVAKGKPLSRELQAYCRDMMSELESVYGPLTLARVS